MAPQKLPAWPAELPKHLTPSAAREVWARTGSLQSGFKPPRDTPEHHRCSRPAEAPQGPSTGHALGCHRGWQAGAVTPPSPGTQHAPPPAATLSPTRPPHAAAGAGAGRARCPLRRAAGARGCGSVAGRHAPAAPGRRRGASSLRTLPAQGKARVRLPQPRRQTAEGSLHQTAGNRKLRCPRRDLFYSYSGKHNCSSQHLPQLRTGIIRSARLLAPFAAARPRGLLQRGTLAQHGPGSRSADEAAATSPAAVPPAPALRQPALPLPVLLYKPGPAFWEAAPSR